MMGLLQHLLDWAMSALGTYGVPIVFAAALLENLFLVGSVVPGDIITAAAAFAATPAQGGTAEVWQLMAAAVLGSMIGMNVSYTIGRLGGQQLIEKWGPRFGISVESIEGAEEYFERNGAITILLARFVAVLKNVAPALAGALKMRGIVFEFFAVVASVGYAAIIIAVGWFLGANFRAGLKYFGAFSWLLFVVLVVIVVMGARSKRRHDQRLLAEKAEEYEQEHRSDGASHERTGTDDDA